MSVEDLLGLTSPQYMRALFTQVFEPIKIGLNTNIVTFSGAGKWVNIKFILDNIQVFDTTFPKCAYMYLNTENLSYSAEEELKTGLMFMQAKAKLTDNSEVEKYLETHTVSVDVNTSLFELLTFLNSQNQRLVIFVDNAHLLSISDRKAQLAIAFLLRIYEAHLAKVTFVFLTKGETHHDFSVLRGLEILYSQHIVKESLIPHDKSCVDAYIRRIRVNKRAKISDKAVENITRCTVGDPLITKYMIQEYLTDGQIRVLLDQANASTEKAYQSINSDYLDEHFGSIVANVSTASKDFLFGQSTTITQYLLDAALVNSEGKPMNEFFAHYLLHRGNRYLLSTGEEVLSPQEQRVFRLLSDALGKIVTREEIAQVLWGDSWKSKFSEQSLDKVISNIRAKLQPTKYSLVVAKGRGVTINRVS